MKFALRRVPLNKGGYDSAGCYWGVGKPLYHYEHEWENDPSEYISDHIRAYNREDARDQIRAKYPNAKFYR
jgi:hypothetical protein